MNRLTPIVIHLDANKLQKCQNDPNMEMESRSRCGTRLRRFILIFIIFNLSKMDPKRVVTFTLLLKPSFPSTCEFAVTLDKLIRNCFTCVSTPRVYKNLIRLNQ